MRSSFLGALLLFTAAPAIAAKPSPKCPSVGLDLAQGVEIVEALRAFTGPKGNTIVERVKVRGKTGNYIGGTVRLTQFDFGNPTKVALVFGFPNIYIPPHAAPYREIFITLSGTTEMRLPDGKTYQLKPGSIFIAEDVNSTGHGGRAGPCGYVALDLQYKDATQPLPLEYVK
jgi:quercetin dioxygenase-like cupin family protein